MRDTGKQSLSLSLHMKVFGITLEEVVPTKTNTKGKPAKQQTAVRYYILTNQISAHAREALLPW